MSYTNLLRHQNVMDDSQRVSCYRGAENTAIYGRCVISRDIVLGCQMEVSDLDLPDIMEPTWSVYLRAGGKDDDLARYVRQVTFRMSPRLPLRLHVADSAPFEISEVLASDFPVEVQVQYVDPRMTATTYMFKPRVVREGHSGMCEEMCDKMIFVNPPAAMRVNLSSTQVLSEVAVADLRKAKKAAESNRELGLGEEEQVGDVSRSPKSDTLTKNRLRLNVGILK
ncbi:YEATS domain-containing protein 4 [Drosophila serrata]|uniref:YEATS domain-containing protein 4 n=1 Tax=Drosophila serrata TaxID=7274 RepID=UPI000A1D3128|nr:YEATS domain-containing protein 4 [Drosophila serrata]KAH8374356.1 hypothetical protein KR200_009668 [Drosophila serrata]